LYSRQALAARPERAAPAAPASRQANAAVSTKSAIALFPAGYNGVTGEPAFGSQATLFDGEVPNRWL